MNIIESSSKIIIYERLIDSRFIESSSNSSNFFLAEFQSSRKKKLIKLEFRVFS